MLATSVGSGESTVSVSRISQSVRHSYLSICLSICRSVYQPVACVCVVFVCAAGAQARGEKVSERVLVPGLPAPFPSSECCRLLVAVWRHLRDSEAIPYQSNAAVAGAATDATRGCPRRLQECASVLTFDNRVL